jgi:hypothetical protein
MLKFDFKALLQDLKRQRAEIDATIAYVERQLGAKLPDNKSITINPERGKADIEADTFHRKNILQASEKYLGMVGRPARSTEEIVDALGRGGLPTTTGSVATILGRDKSGTIQRVKRGLWGLSEWYKTEQ